MTEMPLALTHRGLPQWTFLQTTLRHRCSTQLQYHCTNWYINVSSAISLLQMQYCCTRWNITISTVISLRQLQYRFTSCNIVAPVQISLHQIRYNHISWRIVASTAISPHQLMHYYSKTDITDHSDNITPRTLPHMIHASVPPHSPSGILIGQHDAA